MSLGICGKSIRCDSCGNMIKRGDTVQKFDRQIMHIVCPTFAPPPPNLNDTKTLRDMVTESGKDMRERGAMAGKIGARKRKRAMEGEST